MRAPGFEIVIPDTSYVPAMCSTSHLSSARSLIRRYRYSPTVHYLRGIGDVHVAERDGAQLTATLRTAYEKILHDPLISVTLKDFEKPYFIADGQVGRPGKYDLRGTTTLSRK